MKQFQKVFLMVLASSTFVAATASAQNPQGVLSWGASCPGQVKNTNWAGPISYQLWVGVKNLTAADQNASTDINLIFGPPVADAWRFDAAGCQGPSQYTLNNNPNSKACPAMVGQNPLSLTSFDYDPGAQVMHVRLALAYDPFTPVPGTTYTLWNLIFNHQYSVSGSDGNPNTCDNAATPMCISITDPSDQVYPSVLLTTSNQVEHLTFGSPSDQFAMWNMGCHPVPTEQLTWGRVRQMYR